MKKNMKEEQKPSELEQHPVHMLTRFEALAEESDAASLARSMSFVDIRDRRRTQRCRIGKSWKLLQLSDDELKQHIKRLRTVFKAVGESAVTALTDGRLRLNLVVEIDPDGDETLAELKTDKPNGSSTFMRHHMSLLERKLIFGFARNSKHAKLLMEADVLYYLAYRMFSGSAHHVSIRCCKGSKKSSALMSAETTMSMLEFTVESAQIDSIEELELMLALDGQG